MFDKNRCLVIGEVAQAHDGSLGTAHAYIDAIADAGGGAVKFQTHIAEAESSPEEPWRVRFSPQDASRFDYWKRLEFTEEQWQGLADHARRRGLLFLSTPFSLEAVDLLDRVGVAAWKVSSGEVTNPLLMERIIADGRPIILSTGMSGWSEINQAVERVRAAGRELAVLQCTTAYPCPPEKIGLNLIPEFRRRWQCAVGLSDHSGTIYAGLAAAAVGSEVIEVHVTFSRCAFGPDVPASLTFEDFATLVDGVRFIERMNAAPVDKDAVEAEMEPLRRIFRRGLVAAVDLPAGTPIHREHLTARKPAKGIGAERIADVVGRVTARPLVRGRFLEEEDLLPAQS